MALLAVGMVTLLLVGALWMGWRRLRRRNEVCAASPTRPPLRWLVSPGSCARLHRRLRDSMLLLRQAVPARRGRRRGYVSPLAGVADELELHAVALDCELRVLTHLRGSARAEGQRAVLARVEALERNAQRLAAEGRGSRSGDAGSTDEALRRISDYLDARDAAWEDLARIERDAGLGATA